MSVQYMVGSYQCALEFYKAGLYGGLTVGEKCKLTVTFLLDDFFFQVLDGLGMSALEAPQISASPMAMEQRALTSQTVQAQVALASLTVAEQRASAS